MGDDPLLSAVEKLVNPYAMPTLQTDSERSWVTTITHDGLLQQLRDATEGSISSHAGGSGNDSSRLPFDVGAVTLRDEIHDTLVEWAGEFGVYPSPRDEDTLQACYRAHTDGYLSQRIPDQVHARWIRRVRAWVENIEQMFNPPEIVPLSAECPDCRMRWAYEPIHGDRIDALAVSYWRAGTEAIGGVKGNCRNCGTEWSGRTGILKLMRQVAELENPVVVSLDVQSVSDTPDTDLDPAAPQG